MRKKGKEQIKGHLKRRGLCCQKCAMKLVLALKPDYTLVSSSIYRGPFLK